MSARSSNTRAPSRSSPSTATGRSCSCDSCAKPCATGSSSSLRGKIDPGEDPLATGKRELREECGLTGGSWTPLTSFWTTPGFCRERMHVYLAEGVDDGDADPDDGEEIEVLRWTVAEVESQLGEIEDAKTLVGLLLYLRRRRSTS